MNYKIYKLHFTTPLHLSNESEDYAKSLQTLHSDTLYAALTAALAKVGYDFGTDFNGDLGFTISSLFPFYQKDENTNASYFFPKKRKIDILPERMLSIHKKIKKINWFDIHSFQNILNGKKVNDFFDSNCLFGNYYSAKQIPIDFISSQVFPRVKVSRTGAEDAEPFYMERLFFKDYSGMYFIAEGNNSTLLEKALNILQHEGIGTDRNVGNGFFEWTTDKIELNLPDSNYVINLSLFLPESKEQLIQIFDDNTAYSFKKRGGWVTTSPYNTIRKNRVYMFEEGSIFKSNMDIKGEIADLTPNLSELAPEQQLNHKIFRSGKSLFIPIVI